MRWRQQPYLIAALVQVLVKWHEKGSKKKVRH